MATNTMAAISSVHTVSLINVSRLSSSTSFASTSPLGVAPMRLEAKRNNMVHARATLPEEQSSRAARREVLAGLMAVGAALASTGGAIAASGPGTPGDKRTNEKANDLLKAADDLSNNESPPRFGPGRVGDRDAGRVAQKAGAGAVEELQGGTNKAIEKAKQATQTAKTRMDGIFGKKNKSGDLALGNPADKVASDLKTTGDKVKSDISTTSDKVKKTDAGGLFGMGGKKAEEAKSEAGDFVAQAQKRTGNAANDVNINGQSILEDIKEKHRA